MSIAATLLDTNFFLDLFTKLWFNNCIMFVNRTKLLKWKFNLETKTISKMKRHLVGADADFQNLIEDLTVDTDLEPVYMFSSRDKAREFKKNLEASIRAARV